MIFKETLLKGVYVIETQPAHDERGFYARTWCRREFESRGLDASFVQGGVSFNRKKGTLRGMHYQVDPSPQTKLVHCGKGSVYDVILDLRPASATFRKWVAFELTADNRRMLYIPPGLAHGFQTLEDDTEVWYQMAGFYDPQSERGVRWDDTAFSIRWPPGERTISDRDRSFNGIELS